ncbi:DMT family transporter [Gymnodinialimonas ceratoperidinii]|uniref:DMT family transporter n=1 Tax=Gymnodinialimonas ceratoperidinii TaxID=2856823 RepID=A0A8F6TXI2_9RHOB|nr:DMT family transporter [Gymnodinialimonas ceratoperidinii]QXT39764.1 DMT family transporter [Gymnodinialimonas ceratoperidinii]
MSARLAGKGVALAAFGALVLTPDAMLMRLSGMEGVQMLAWRSTLMGSVLIAAWAVSRAGEWQSDLAALWTLGGLAIALCQGINGMLFTFGIAGSPATPVLLGVATVPVISALLAWLLMGEATGRATWLTIAVVLAGIALAVLGKAEAGAPWDAAALRGALYGLGVAVCLAISFVLIRKHATVPILPSVGLGALGAGALGIVLTGPSQMVGEASLWPIFVTGAVVLPVSFYCLSLASRHTAAANVSLLLLLETVLGPLWVWLGIGEAPTPMMLGGGVIVVAALAVYLMRARVTEGRRKRSASAPPLP